MKCDNCGFEHNSKSVCPKCGTRVVFVNEDYLRRKQEWEEQQRRGGADQLPSGILDSTKGEQQSHKEQQNKNRKGGSQRAGLSFDILKNSLLKILAVVILFFRKHFVKKRGNHNPVLKDFKPEEKKSGLQVEKLIISRKTYKSKWKPVLIVGGSLCLLMLIAITTVVIFFGRDTSKVLYFDGTAAYYTSDSETPVFGNESDSMLLISPEEGTYIGVGEQVLYVVTNGKVQQTEVKNPTILAYNQSCSTIVFVDDGQTKIYHKGEVTTLNIDKNTAYTGECYVSDNGTYYALTACLTADDTDTYTLYVGDVTGEVKAVLADGNSKEIVQVTNEGDTIFQNMTTGDYGIVNGKTLMMATGDQVKTLAENVSKVQISKNSGELFYIDTQGILSTLGTNYTSAPIAIDEKVERFVENPLDLDLENCIYQKEDGYWLYQEDGNLALFESDSATLKVCYQKNQEALYCYDLTDVYLANQQGTLSQVCSIAEEQEPVWLEQESRFLVVDQEGSLYALGSQQKVLDTKVSTVTAIENSDAFGYIKDHVLYMQDGTGKKAENMGTVTINGSFQTLIYSHSNIFYLNEDGNLMSISTKNQEQNQIAPAKTAYLEK